MSERWNSKQELAGIPSRSTVIPPTANELSLAPGRGARLKALTSALLQRNIAIPVLILVTFPAFFLSTVQRPLFQLGGNRIDPYVYAAYINDYARTIERFGSTYFSARIAYIFPERALVSVLGLEGGYYAYRFLGLSVAIASVYAIGQRYYGPATAVLVAAWACFTPWFPRSLLWTHYDGFAVVYLLVAAAFLLVPTRWRFAGHVAAGGVFALAVDCNLVVLAVGAAFLPSWLILHRSYGVKWMLCAALCLLGGFILSYAALILSINWEFPGHGWEGTTTVFSATLSLLAGGTQKWFVPLSELLLHPFHYSTAISIPTALFVIGSVVLLRQRFAQTASERFALAALLYLGLMGALALSLHFFFHHPWLANHFYNVYFFPASALVLIAVSGNLEIKYCCTRTIYGVGSLIIVFWIFLSFGTPFLVSWATATVGVSVLVAAVFVALASYAIQRGRAAAVLIGMLVVSYLPVFGTEYRIVASPNERQREWDVYHGAVFLQQFINSQVPTSRTIGFWYSNFELLMYSVQSMFLWEYSRVAPADQGHSGMPVLDERTRAAMVKKNFLALISASEAETNNAVNTIANAGLPFRVVNRATYTGETWGFNIVLLRAFPGPVGAHLFDVSLSQLVVMQGSTLTSVGNDTRLVTSGQQWAYSLIGPLRDESNQSAAGRAVVRVELEVQNGSVGIAIEDANDTSNLFEVKVGQSSEMEAVDIEIPDLSSAGRFIVRNYRALPSTVLIRSIRVFRTFH